MADRVRVPVPVAFVFAYDGTRFASYARQADHAGRTVEGALAAALVEAGAAPDGERLALRSGSRTDRGVSARENVVAFRSLIPSERLPGAVGARVPGLYPLAAAAVGPGFDPRRAERREYRYFVPETALGTGGRQAFQGALAGFRGRHDFAAFARLEPDRSPIREVYETAVEDGPSGLIVARIVGASFLWQQVRRMVAAALAVAAGNATTRELGSWLARGREAVTEAGRLGVAPAEPLVLWRVVDPRLRFRRQAADAARVAAALRPAWGAAAAQHALVAGILTEWAGEGPPGS